MNRALPLGSKQSQPAVTVRLLPGQLQEFILQFGYMDSHKSVSTHYFNVSAKTHEINHLVFKYKVKMPFFNNNISE